MFVSRPVGHQEPAIACTKIQEREQESSDSAKAQDEKECVRMDE